MYSPVTKTRNSIHSHATSFDTPSLSEDKDPHSQGLTTEYFVKDPRHPGCSFLSCGQVKAKAVQLWTPPLEDLRCLHRGANVTGKFGAKTNAFSVLASFPQQNGFDQKLFPNDFCTIIENIEFEEIRFWQVLQLSALLLVCPCCKLQKCCTRVTFSDVLRSCHGESFLGRARRCLRRDGLMESRLRRCAGTPPPHWLT